MAFPSQHFSPPSFQPSQLSVNLSTHQYTAVTVGSCFACRVSTQLKNTIPTLAENSSPKPPPPTRIKPVPPLLFKLTYSNSKAFILLHNILYCRLFAVSLLYVVCCMLYVVCALCYFFVYKSHSFPCSLALIVNQWLESMESCGICM